MKRIAIEEHFYNEEYLEYLKSKKIVEMTKDENGNRVMIFGGMKMEPDALSKVADIGEGRVKQMDEDGIDMQVLSLMIPGLGIFDPPTAVALARESNDALARAIMKYPGRLAGFAALPVQEPAAAADELERAVRELSLKGALINSHVNGEFLDNQKYWVIFAKAQELDVPVYLHPVGLPSDMIKPYLAYPGLSGSMLGYAHEVGLHAMRLICSGLFVKYPNLNIILGHLGEALPFWLSRMDSRWRKEAVVNDPATAGKIKKTPGQYIKDNFFVTTSGIFWQPALSCTFQALGADKIMFAVDYPAESSREAVEFLDTAPISATDKEKIYHINAEKLLKL